MSDRTPSAPLGSLTSTNSRSSSSMMRADTGPDTCTRGRGSVDEVKRRPDDRVCVDTEVFVEIGDVAGLPEVVHTHAGDRLSANRPEEAQRVRVPVEDADDGCRPFFGEYLVENPVRAVAKTLTRAERAKDEIGRSKADDVGSETPLRQVVCGRKNFGDDGAHADERHL